VKSQPEELPKEAGGADRSEPPFGRARPIAALGVAAVLCLFFAPALFGQGEFVYRDTGRLHAPVKRWIAAELAQGRLPEWNPYAGLGTPVIATAQDAVLHPFTLLVLALPPGAAMKAWVLLSFALAAAGTFAWVRLLGGSAAACAVGAVGFALSGPLVSSSDNVQFLTTYAALPWIFAAAHVYVVRGGPGRLLGVAAASALCAAAGDPQAWGFAMGLLPLYAVAFSERGGRAAALGRGAAAAIAGVIAAAPFVLPLALWAPESQRAGGLAAEDLARWNLGPARLLELAVPELLRGDPADPVSPVFAAYGGDALAGVPWFLSVYLGVGILALAALGVAVERRARILAAGGVLFTWAALGPHAGFGAIATRLPVLGAFRYWEKVTVWVGLLAALAAARGVDALLAGTGARRLARAAGATGAMLLAAAGGAALFPGTVRAWAGGTAREAALLAGNVSMGAARAGLVLALVALLAAAIARAKLVRAAPLAIASVIALDLFGGNAGAYVIGPPENRATPPLAAVVPPGGRVVSPFSDREDRWPDRGRLGSTWEWIRRTLGASWNVPLRVGSMADYVGLRSGRWTRFRSGIPDDAIAPTLGEYGFAYLVVPGTPEVAAKAGAAPPYRIAATDPELPAWLVEIPHRPRAYVAGALRSADAEGAFELVRRRDTAATVIEGPVPEGYTPPAGEARIVRDDPGTTVLDARADRRALVVLSDLFAPGWTAEVDGRPAEIVRANALVRGVWVDAGAHQVRFSYRTPGLAAGWAIALAGALALAVWWAVERRRARAARSP